MTATIIASAVLCIIYGAFFVAGGTNFKSRMIGIPGLLVGSLVIFAAMTDQLP